MAADEIKEEAVQVKAASSEGKEGGVERRELIKGIIAGAVGMGGYHLAAPWRYCCIECC